MGPWAVFDCHEIDEIVGRNARDCDDDDFEEDHETKESDEDDGEISCRRCRDRGCNDCLMLDW